MAPRSQDQSEKLARQGRSELERVRLRLVIEGCPRGEVDNLTNAPSIESDEEWLEGLANAWAERLAEVGAATSASARTRSRAREVMS